MILIILYQKRDSLGKIMYKLNETKEKIKFLKKERTLFAFFILLCIPQVACRLLNIEEQTSPKLIALAWVEIITLVLMIVVATTLLYYLHTYHKKEY